jgi:hypothetical protein
VWSNPLERIRGQALQPRRGHLPSLRNGGGLVDAPGRGLLGAKGEYPLRVPYPQPNLLVYSRQKIDFLSERRGLREIEIAEQLGIAKMVSASLSELDSGLALEVQIIDIKTGLIEGSHEVRGSEKQLIEMQNEAAIEVMRSLKVPVNQAELETLLAKRTNDRLDDYKLLTESMGGGIEGEPSKKEPRSAAPQPWFALLAPRRAEASEADEAAIRVLLERYRAALESEDMARRIPACRSPGPDAGWSSPLLPKCRPSPGAILESGHRGGRRRGTRHVHAQRRLRRRPERLTRPPRGARQQRPSAVRRQTIVDHIGA